MTPTFIANIAGFAGIFVIAGAYLYLSYRPVRPDRLYFSLNIAGSVLLAISLSIEVNVPSLSLQIFWIAVSLLGLFRLRGKPA
jgi:hypothetical protein